MTPRSSPHEPIGLLAGAGRFPIAVAEQARRLGMPVVCVGISHAADPQLQHLTAQFHWCGLAQLGKMVRCFRQAGVRRWMMAGKVDHRVMVRDRWWFVKHWPDLRTLRLLSNRASNSDDALLSDLVSEFAKDGLECLSALELCPELLAGAGVLTRRSPTADEHADIDFGWEVARTMGRLDVGQSVVVSRKAIIAVEAIEGTDEAILRAGKLCPRGGFTVVKVAKPQQDMRFDVPTVGTHTIATMQQAGGRVLAIEANRTIILDRDETIALANRHGFTIIALGGSRK